MAVKGTKIDGDVSVGRNVSAGGDAHVAGCMQIGHNLVVKGWLDAKNIKGPSKGLFSTVEKLRSAYATPHEGWWALVGRALPASLYIAEGGDWVDTGNKAGNPTIDSALDNEAVQELMKELQSIAGDVSRNASNIQDLNTVTDVTKKELARNVDDVSELEKKIKDVWRTVKFGGILSGSVTVILQSLIDDVRPENVFFYNGAFVFQKFDADIDKYYANARNGADYNAGRSARTDTYFIHNEKHYYFDGAELRCLSTNTDAPVPSAPLLSEMTGDEILFIIKNGENYTVTGNILKEFCIKELDNKINPLSVVVFGGGVFEKGTLRNITVQWTVKKGDSVVTAERVTVNGEVVAASHKTFKDVSQDTVYKVEVLYKGVTGSASAKVSFVAPMFFGFAFSEKALNLDIKSLNKQPIRTSPKGKYSITNDETGKYLWLCVPKGMSVNSVKSGGFDVPMNPAESGRTDISEYVCYRSNSAINLGVMDINID